MKASELRKEARESLKGKWGKAACITLAFMAISFAIAFVQELVGEGTTIYNIIEIAYFIISIPLSFGLLIAFMKLKRSQEVKVFDFFKEGFSRFSKAFGIWFHTLLKLLIPILCYIGLLIAIVIVAASSIIGSMSGNTVTTTSNAAISLFIVLAQLVVLIYIIIKSMLYVLAYNISYDNPELSAKECVLKSAELMKENRGKYFLLELSFIGWAILAVCTLGIGMLWLTPYMQIAAICFYEKLANPEVEKAEETIKTEE